MQMMMAVGCYFPLAAVVAALNTSKMMCVDLDGQEVAELQNKINVEQFTENREYSECLISNWFGFQTAQLCPIPRQSRF